MPSAAKRRVAKPVTSAAAERARVEAARLLFGKYRAPYNASEAFAGRKRREVELENRRS